MTSQPISTSGTRRTNHSQPVRQDWRELGPEFIAAWGRPRGKVQPEHFTIYGPSGSGKSTLEAWSLNARCDARQSHAVIVATKKQDSTLSEMGWPIIEKWPPDYGKTRTIFWARGGLSDSQQDEQRRRLHAMMNQIWVPNSNIIVAWDELPYLCADLNLRRPVTTFYREGRGNGITNVAVLQRPTDVTRYVHSEAAWVAAFPSEDEDDRERVAEVFGNRRYYRDVLDDLDREQREFLIRRKVTGETYISHLPADMARPRRREPERRGWMGYRRRG